MYAWNGKQDPRKKTLLMNPGPVEFEDSVLQEMSVRGISHLDPATIEVFGQCLEDMRKVFLAPDGQPLIVTGSGTLGWDMTGANLIDDGDNALVINTGYFGDNFGECLGQYGARVTHLKAPVGNQPQPEELKDVLRKQPFKVVTMTQVDTSSGVLTDVKTFASIIREIQPKAVIVVDAVCALGGEELRMKEWDVDVVLTGSQKCVAVPTGLSLMMIRPRALSAFSEHKDLASYYCDWGNWLPIMKSYEARKPAYFATPSVNHLFALKKAFDILLSKGGMEKRFEEHKLVAEAFQAALSEIGLELVTVPGRSAHTLSCIRYPGNVSGGSFLPKVVSHGVSLAGGLYKEIKTQYFRVGHMGPSTRRLDHIIKTFIAIEDALIESGYPISASQKEKALKKITILKSKIPITPESPLQLLFNKCCESPQSQILASTILAGAVAIGVAVGKQLQK